MHDHLDEMAMLGLVDVEKRNEGSTKGGGQYKTVALNQDLKLVVEALDETMETVGVHGALQSKTDV
jgi:cell division control protein 6